MNNIKEKNVVRIERVLCMEEFLETGVRYKDKRKKVENKCL